MKLITFNVNGLRSIMNKDKNGNKMKVNTCDNSVLIDIIQTIDPDIICLQEVRCNTNTDISCLQLNKFGYTTIAFNCATKKGYSGTSIFAKRHPKNIWNGFPHLPDDDLINTEGRVITVEFETYYVVNVYVPNSRQDLSRLDYRINTWEVALRNHVNALKKRGKSVIVCGDLNVAAEDIDVHNPKSAKGSHGFTEEEKLAFSKLLTECKMIDTFRFMNGQQAKYSWFSPFANSRKRGKGWRIDYVLVTDDIAYKIKKADILGEYHGSDHCACLLECSVS